LNLIIINVLAKSSVIS